MPKSVLVAPVGKQGFATVEALLNRGNIVHFLARNPSSDAATKLKSLGAVLHVGDLSSQEALESAMEGMDGVFLAVPAGGPDPEEEIRIGKIVVETAVKKGVNHIVLSTVARTGEHTIFPGWNEKYPLAWYWVNKNKLEDIVRCSTIPTWTILRPAAFHQMFCRPEVDFLYPGLADKHVLRLPFYADTRLDLIHVPDIAKFAAAAFESPSEYSGKEISLAAERLTAAEIAEQLSAIAGSKVTAELLDDAQASTYIEQGHMGINAQIWQRDVGYGVDIEAIEQFGIPLTPLSQALDKEPLRW